MFKKKKKRIAHRCICIRLHPYCDDIQWAAALLALKMSKANSDWPNTLKPHEAMMYVSLGSATSLLFLFLLKFLSFFCTLIISAVYNTYWSDYCITCILLKDLLLISLLFFFLNRQALNLCCFKIEAVRLDTIVCELPVLFCDCVRRFSCSFRLWAAAGARLCRAC